MRKLIPYLLLVIMTACGQKAPTEKPQTVTHVSAEDTSLSRLQQKEQVAADKGITDSLGGLVTTISFEVNTKDIKDYPDGIIPYASIEKADADIPKLLRKDQVVIHDTSIRIIIDYPLNNPCAFLIYSPSGFTTASLLKAISKQYFLIYSEEESTATVKTLPMKKRTMYNRNQTNGKYGIWGHDIGDLVLTEAVVYRNGKGEVTVTLEIDS